MRKLLAFMVVMALAVTSPAGCAKSGVNQNVPQELVVALGQAEIGNLDPYERGSSSWYLRPLVYETLIHSTVKGVEPVLAESWTVSEDGKTWTFKLRKNARFHDGTLFTADIAKKQIDQSMQNKVSGLGSKRPPLPLTAVETPDANTLVLRLSAPYAPLLSELSGVWMISPNSFDSAGKFIKPVGTGAFIPVSLDRQTAVFKPFKDYWRGKPALDKLTIRCIPDHSSRVMAFEAGEVDIIGADMSGVDAESAKRLERSGKYQVVTKAEAHIEMIGFNIDREPLNNLKIRQAINYAIDRQALVTYLLGGYGFPAKGPIGFDTSIPWTDTGIEGFPFDPGKARQLLAEAGWNAKDGEGYLTKNGRQLKLTLAFCEQRPITKALMEIIQSQLRDVGIKVEIRAHENASYSEVIERKDFNIAYVPHYGKREDDPYPYLGIFFFSKGKYPFMHNEKFDRLYMDQFRQVDQVKRHQMYCQMQQIIMEECPFAFLFHPQKVVVMKKDIRNFDIVYGFDCFQPFWKVKRGEK